MHAILDVSRLLLSAHRPSPSGIDRVEMAYARRWLDRPARDGTFVAEGPWGRFGALPRGRVADLLDAVQEVWDGGPGGGRAGRAWRILAGTQAFLAAGGGRSALRAALAAHRRPVFLLVSHRSLDRAGPIRALRRAGAAFVPMLHDLIPLTHPEYARPAQVARHARRVANAAGLADGIIVNSEATAATLLARWPGRAAAPPPISVAPLGLAPSRRHPASPAPPSPIEPYFVCLGTIEPRKNHLLLLHLWRDFARPGPASRPPRLLLIGRRGWENENILDLLDRCAALRGGGLVTETGPLPDGRVAALLAGARALLFPSFAEGYGLPLAEALALGVPAVCSDLPALREVGGGVPDYLDPLDGAAWRRAVLDYARPGSAPRAAQLARLRGWRAPGWDAHFAAVDALLDRVAAGAGAAAGALLHQAPAGAGAGALPHRAPAADLVLPDARAGLAATVGATAA